MTPTGQSLYGYEIYIDDSLCVVPNYRVSDAFRRTSPDLAADLQKWANKRFGVNHQVVKADLGVHGLYGGQKGEQVLVMSRLTFVKAQLAIFEQSELMTHFLARR